jgi:hypothetical protein
MSTPDLTKRKKCRTRHFEHFVWLPTMPGLIRQASAAGCDAIIEIQEKHLESPGNFETGAKHYTAIGVVYK